MKERYFILKGLSIFNLKGFFFRSLIVIKEIKVSTDTFG